MGTIGKILGSRFAQLRKAAGLKQTDFGPPRNIASESTIVRFEGGDQIPHEDTLEALIRQVKSDPETFLMSSPQDAKKIERADLLLRLFRDAPALNNRQLSDVIAQIELFLSSKTTARSNKLR